MQVQNTVENIENVHVLEKETVHMIEIEIRKYCYAYN